MKTFISKDQKELSYRIWPIEQPKALVQIAHGMAEHIDRYDDFAKYLNQHGFYVFGNDHRGHGKNILDKKGFFAEENGWELVVSDMKALQDQMKEEFPGLPVVLIGHSMGSFLSRTFASFYPQALDALVIVGSGHGMTMTQSIFRKLIQWNKKRNGGQYYSDFINDTFNKDLLKKFKNPRTKFDWLNRDEKAVDEYIADPLCGFPVTNQFFLDMVHGVELVSSKETMVKLSKDLPILIISGDHDPVSNFGKDMISFQSDLKSLEISSQLILYPQMRHEILNEFDKEKVYQDVVDFLDSKLK